MFAGMTAREANQHIIKNLSDIYPGGEAAAISDLVIEHLTGLPKSRRTGDEILLNEDLVLKIEIILQRLLQHEPVQYILNESWFCGLKIYVDKNVLIPRPETEELVEWIVSENRQNKNEISILDVGTGSGCIPLALKNKLPHAVIWSCDVSQGALNVARKNANTHKLDVNFIHLNFLDRNERNSLPTYHIIVSNPPYIPEKDRQDMDPNVVNFEPSQALFVPNDNALLFYEALADFGINHLEQDGCIYAEIHESLGTSTAQLFAKYEYATELRKDMQGKDRMIKACKNFK